MSFPDYINIHNKFKLNGYHYGREELCNLAVSYIKEGKEYEKEIGLFLLEWFDENEFIKVQTSGTTGTPKIIKIKKSAMVHSASATGDFFSLFPSQKILHCLPVKFIAGKMMLVRALILGLEVTLKEPSSNPLENNTTLFDFAAMVPMQVKNSLKYLNCVKTLIIGSASVGKELELKLLKLPTNSFETYGMTETITHIAAREMGMDSFTVLPNIEISSDDRGCLVINAPKISKNNIVTNDIVELLNDKQFRLLGRIDNVINSGGFKLFPEQIENKLTPYIKQRFFISSIKDDLLGEKVVLVIEGKKNDLEDDIFKGLGKYEIPKKIFFIDKFIETKTGKIMRKEIMNSL